MERERIGMLLCVWEGRCAKECKCVCVCVCVCERERERERSLIKRR